MSKNIKLFKELYSICLPFLCLDLENNVFPLNVPVVQFFFLLYPYMFDYKEKYKNPTVPVVGKCLIGALMLGLSGTSLQIHQKFILPVIQLHILQRTRLQTKVSALSLG